MNISQSIDLLITWLCVQGPEPSGPRSLLLTGNHQYRVGAPGFDCRWMLVAQFRFLDYSCDVRTAGSSWSKVEEVLVDFEAPLDFVVSKKARVSDYANWTKSNLRTLNNEVLRTMQVLGGASHSTLDAGQTTLVWQIWAHPRVSSLSAKGSKYFSSFCETP